MAAADEPADDVLSPDAAECATGPQMAEGGIEAAELEKSAAAVRARPAAPVVLAELVATLPEELATLRDEPLDAIEECIAHGL